MDSTRLAMDRSKGCLEFSIEYLGDDGLLQYLCDRTSVLKKLRLIACYEISEEAVATAARRQSLLEEIDVSFGYFYEKATEIIGRECPQLKTFKFNDQWYDIHPLDQFDNVGALGIANTMQQLDHLQIIGNRMTNRGLRVILHGCPHLETLDICMCCNVKMDANMGALCARLTNIRFSEDSVDDYQFEACNDNYLKGVVFGFRKCTRIIRHRIMTLQHEIG